MYRRLKAESQSHLYCVALLCLCLCQQLLLLVKAVSSVSKSAKSGQKQMLVSQSKTPPSKNKLIFDQNMNQIFCRSQIFVMSIRKFNWNPFLCCVYSECVCTPVPQNIKVKSIQCSFCPPQIYLKYLDMDKMRMQCGCKYAPSFAQIHID